MYGALLLFEDDFIHIVSIAFTALILTELFMIALTIHTWHYLMIISEILSLGFYFASIFLFPEYFGQSLAESFSRFKIGGSCSFFHSIIYITHTWTRARVSILQLSGLCLEFPR